MRRVLVLFLTTVTALATLAASPSPASFVPVATDPCAGGPDADNPTSPDWEDLCEVAFATVRAEEDEPVTLAVRLTAVGDLDGRPVQMVYDTEWAAGDCAISLFHRDDNVQGEEGEDVLTAVCGFEDGPCEPVGVVNMCEDDTARLTLEAPVPPPAVDGTTLTWTVTFDGDLAPLAEVHEAGDELVPGRTRAAHAPRVRVLLTTSSMEPAQAPTFCTGEQCYGVFNEFVDADRTFVVG